CGSSLKKFAVPLVEDIIALKLCDIVNWLCTEVDAEASYMKAWRSQAINKKCDAEEIKKSYQCINSLLNNLIIENPESVIAFEGILDTVQTKLPNTFHAYCIWHIEKNINTKFKTKLGDKIWAVAKALHIKEFNKIIKEISDLHEEASIYLSEIPSTTWAFSKYPRSKFGYLTSNTSKFLNSWLCDEHLVKLFETIILFVHKVNTLYYNCRTIYSSI
ncbi:15745_t:CDS:2, partial [Dentiscutata erythropus]